MVAPFSALGASDPSVMRPGFRILALDGGGIKGAFTAKLLAEWEANTEQRIVDHFDLIAGTSTGGIIALGLGLGLPAKDILKFYQEHGPRIFPNVGWARKKLLSVRHFFRPKYAQGALQIALQQVFQDKKLGHAKTRLLITTYDAIAGRIFLIKTAHHELFKYDYQQSAVEVALATSAAPTFFDFAEFEGHEKALYLDGGVWANNPTLAAVCEAHHFLKVPLDQVDVLSVGTTRVAPHTVARMQRGWLGLLAPGQLHWFRHILTLMFNAQMETSLVVAELLTKGRVFRVDETVPDGWFSLDAIEQIGNMVALARGLAVKREILSMVEQRFLNGVHAESFTPCYAV
jgi:patatin-like phospholipase/acyl hydrolase